MEGTMKHAIGILALAILAIGCSRSSKPQADAGPATGTPNQDETRSCICAYLDQCGWKEIELVEVKPCDKVPSQAIVVGDAWAYMFTANYSNLIGERQNCEKWTAVLYRVDGKPCVKCCYNNANQLVGGHR